MNKIVNNNDDNKINFEDFKIISAQVINDTQAEVDYHLLFLLLKPRLILNILNINKFLKSIFHYLCQ